MARQNVIRTQILQMLFIPDGQFSSSNFSPHTTVCTNINLNSRDQENMMLCMGETVQGPERLRAEMCTPNVLIIVSQYNKGHLEG